MRPTHLLAPLALLFLPAASCPAGKTALETVPSDLSFTVCAAAVYETDSAKGAVPGAIVADVVAGCAAQLAQIIATVASPPPAEQIAAGALGTKVALDMVVGRITPEAANVRIASIYAAAKLPAPRALAMPGGQP